MMKGEGNVNLVYPKCRAWGRPDAADYLLKKSQVLIATEGEVPGGDVEYVSGGPISASMPEGAAGRKGAVGQV